MSIAAAGMADENLICHGNLYWIISVCFLFSLLVGHGHGMNIQYYSICSVSGWFLFRILQINIFVVVFLLFFFVFIICWVQWARPLRLAGWHTQNTHTLRCARALAMCVLALFYSSSCVGLLFFILSFRFVSYLFVCLWLGFACAHDQRQTHGVCDREREIIHTYYIWKEVELQWLEHATTTSRIFATALIGRSNGMLAFSFLHIESVPFGGGCGKIGNGGRIFVAFLVYK